MSATKALNPEEVVKCLQLAKMIAHQYGHQYVTLEHLLAALLEQPDVQEVLRAFKADSNELRVQVDDYLRAGFVPSLPNAMPVETEMLTNTVRLAVGQVMFSQRNKAMPVDLLVGLLHQQDTHAQAILHAAGLTSLEVKRYLSHGSAAEESVVSGRGGVGEAVREITSPEEARKVLEKYCTNLNAQAKESKIDPLIGRIDEVQQLIQITARRQKNNTIMVGEPGVGKTAIAEGLALMISKGEVPDIIKDAEVYALDIGALIAGTRFRGDFEERIKQVLKALTFIAKPILFIDEVHTILGAGSGNQGSMDVANLLKPALAKGALRCIGSTTYEEYRKYFEKDRALARRFKKVDINEPTVSDAKLILRGLRSYYEDYHHVKFTDAALDAAVDLTARYVQNLYLPDKAIDVVDNAGARQRILPEEERRQTVDVAEIEWEVSKLAKIPPATVQEDEKEKLRRLGDDLRARVFGQDGALATLVDAVQISRAGLKEPNKPAGSYLFSGPTGVGKTETARQLAKTLGVELVKFDMSEYMEKHTVAKLIGAPPGYVGHGEGGAGAGLLTNAIETYPHSVLLLDEVEKAHPDIFNVLLQVMDDAKLTNSNGKTVHFENVILIMSTNAGAADMARAAIGFGSDVRTGDDEEAIKRFFAPEFRNRLDAVVKFDRLQPEHMRMVVEKFVRELADLTASRNVEIELSPDAADWLAKKGYDPQFGARPLKRLIAEEIKKPLSRLLLFGDLAKGGKARINVANDSLRVAAA